MNYIWESIRIFFCKLVMHLPTTYWNFKSYGISHNFRFWIITKFRKKNKKLLQQKHRLEAIYPSLAVLYRVKIGTVLLPKNVFQKKKQHCKINRYPRSPINKLGWRGGGGGVKFVENNLTSDVHNAYDTTRRIKCTRTHDVNLNRAVKHRLIETSAMESGFPGDMNAKQLLAKGIQEIETEFNLLAMYVKSNPSADVAVMPQNRFKNRYVNALPCKQSGFPAAIRNVFH